MYSGIRIDEAHSPTLICSDHLYSEKWPRENNKVLMIYQGLPCGSGGKESTCNAGDLDLIPGLGRSPGEGKGYPLQYSGLENPMDYIVTGLQRVGHD